MIECLPNGKIQGLQLGVDSQNHLEQALLLLSLGLRDIQLKIFKQCYCI